MSWNKYNLYNLQKRTRPEDISRRTVFQQKWHAKRELRAYHAPNVTEKQLIDRHWKNQLPLRQMTAKEKEKLPPVQALAFGELERRLDVALFRAHFAKSIWQARASVVQGHVLVNGEKCRYPARRLHSGDMVTINPSVIPTLMKPAPLETIEEETEAEVKEASTEATEETLPETSASTEPTAAERTTDTPPITPSATPESSRTFTKSKTRAEIDALRHPKALPFHEIPYMSPWMFVPPYLEISYKTHSFIFLRPPLPQPSVVEIPSPHPPELHSLAYEWYSSIKKSKTRRPPSAYPVLVDGVSVKLKPKFELMLKRQQYKERKEIEEIKFGDK
ncbi:mitochondrial 37S ribosomal protein nam9 [Chytridiales sp. JEL 0842]|nr:mitochondrial 37S ribosomal protein nam9 [Chytridiales sp. JEL 0842]